MISDDTQIRKKKEVNTNKHVRHMHHTPSRKIHAQCPLCVRAIAMKFIHLDTRKPTISHAHTRCFVITTRSKIQSYPLQGHLLLPAHHRQPGHASGHRVHQCANGSLCVCESTQS